MLPKSASFHQGRSLVMGPGKELGPWICMGSFSPCRRERCPIIKARGDRLIIEVGFGGVNPRGRRTCVCDRETRQRASTFPGQVLFSCSLPDASFNIVSSWANI